MKRSEMLRIMEDCFSKYNNFVNWNINSINKKLLEAIEDAGMLPPARDIYCTCDHATGDANKWDREDE